MNYRDSLDFELYVGSLIDNSNIKTDKELTEFARELHEILENVIQDYADDNDLDDYDPYY